jgi:tetratricopeptide (TPR) repeat protein
MKPKLLEQIVGAGLALSLNVLVGCQVLDKAARDFIYIPPLQEKIDKELKKRMDEHIMNAQKEYRTLYTFDGDYKVTRNSTFISPKQKEILAQIIHQIPKGYTPKYQTSAHMMLNMEQEFQVTADDYKTLDNVLDSIITKIKTKPAYTKKDAFNIFKTIASQLETYEKKENELFSYGLRDKIFDCDNFSIIYASVGEILNFPIKMINVMDHVFVRWELGKDHLNWDNMWGDKDNKAFLDWVYKVNFGLDAFFVEMNQKEIAALGYFNRGSYLFYLHEYKKSITEFNKALALYPNFKLAFFNKGYSLINMEEFDEAINIFNKVIHETPEFANAYNARGLVNSKMGLYEKAIDDFTKTIELNPKSDVAYLNRADVWEKMGDTENAVRDRKEGLFLKYKQMESDGIIWVE